MLEVRAAGFNQNCGWLAGLWSTSRTKPWPIPRSLWCRRQALRKWSGQPVGVCYSWSHCWLFSWNYSGCHTANLSPPIDFNSMNWVILLGGCCGNLNNKELSINSIGVLDGSWLFCIKYSPCLVSFWSMLGVRWYGGLNEKLSISIHQGSSSFLACQDKVRKWVGPINIVFECSLCRPPHRLQTWPKSLPNMESFVCKTTNS